MTDTKNIKKYFGFFTDFLVGGFNGITNLTKSDEEKQKEKSKIEIDKSKTKRKKDNLDVKKNEIDAKIKLLQSKLTVQLNNKEELIEKKADETGNHFSNSSYEDQMKEVEKEMRDLEKYIEKEREKLKEEEEKLTDLKREEYINWYREGTNHGSWLFFGLFYILWLFVLWSIWKIIKKIFIFISGIIF